MASRHLDRFILTLGFLLIVASFLVLSTGKRDDQNFKTIIAELKFLQNSVQTKMAGSVAWFTGEEEEKINSYGMGLTSTASAAHYLYMDKTQIISLDNSLIEFLPDEEVRLGQGSATVLNPTENLKLSDQNGRIIPVEKGVMYTATEKGIESRPIKFEKIWAPNGPAYQVSFTNDILTEKFLLAPPMLTIKMKGTTCVAEILPIGGDVGDVTYQAISDGRPLSINGLNVSTPSSDAIIKISALSNGVRSAWREIQVPSHCIKEGPEPILEDLEFFAISSQQIFIESSEESYPFLVSFLVDGGGKFAVIGPKIDRESDISSSFNREYKLGPGLYEFSLKKGNALYTRKIEVKVKPPFHLKNSIFIED